MRSQLRTLAAAIAVSGCALLTACTTVYQPLGATGGYRDTRLSDNSYIVEFSGNGNTSKEAVWNYWIYRCADLTRQKGFSYFTVLPKAKTGDAGGGGWAVEREARNDAGDGEWTEMKGGGGGYVYIPSYSGGRITTWRSSATILMFKSMDEPGARFALSATVVLDSLKSFVTSQGRDRTMSSEELVKRAITASIPIAGPQVPSVPWSGGAGGRVEMKDLGALLPE